MIASSVRVDHLLGVNSPSLAVNFFFVATSVNVLAAFGWREA